MNNALQDLKNTKSILYGVTLIKITWTVSRFEVPTRCYWRCSFFGMWCCVIGWVESCCFEGTEILWNVGNYPPNHTAWHPRRPAYLHQLLPENLTYAEHTALVLQFMYCHRSKLYCRVCTNDNSVEMRTIYGVG